MHGFQVDCPFLTFSFLRLALTLQVDTMTIILQCEQTQLTEKKQSSHHLNCILIEGERKDLIGSALGNGSEAY